MSLRICVFFLCLKLSVTLCAVGGLRQDGKSEMGEDHKNYKHGHCEEGRALCFPGSFC